MTDITNITSDITSELINYDNFICYFENYYISELSGYRIYETRMAYLRQLKKIALEHRHIYELRHGQGAYQANLGKYGALNRTPVQIVEGDFNSTHLLLPKIAHNYVTGCAHHNVLSKLRWVGFAVA